MHEAATMGNKLTRADEIARDISDSFQLNYSPQIRLSRIHWSDANTLERAQRRIYWTKVLAIPSSNRFFATLSGLILTDRGGSRNVNARPVPGFFVQLSVSACWYNLEVNHESNCCPRIWWAGSSEVRGVPRPGSGSGRGAGAGRRRERESDRLQAACWINEGFLSHAVSGPHRSRYGRDRGQDWAGSGRLFRR